MQKTALVADDSATIRDMVGRTLGTAGFEVLQAAHGEEALEYLDGRRLKLIVTDLNMPVLDGFGFIRQARARPRYRFTPILLLTTECAEHLKAAGRQAGGMVKPFHPQRLLEVVAQLVLA